MRVARDIAIILILIIVLYLGIMWVFAKIPYKGKSLIYITNTYLVWKGGDTWQKFQEFNPEESHDIIFMGSSRCYRFYNPAIFEAAGYKSFNLGSSAQSLENTSILLKKLINSNNCKHLILDCTINAYRGDGEGFESTSDLITNINSNKIACEIAFREFDIRFLNLLVLRQLLNSSPPVYYNEEYSNRGFCTNDRILSNAVCEALNKKEQNAGSVDWNIARLEMLEDMLEWCRNNNIKVTMVMAPITNGCPQSWLDECEKTIQPICEKYGHNFINFSRLQEIDQCKHYYDPSHINRAGVEIFNKQFIEWLQNKAAI